MLVSILAAVFARYSGGVGVFSVERGRWTDSDAVTCAKEREARLQVERNLVVCTFGRRGKVVGIGTLPTDNGGTKSSIDAQKV